jgi:hypothetical protein
MPLNTGANAAIAVCPRCKFKVQYTDLKQDPNTKNWYCPDCVDEFDPWRLPSRKAENIALQHPRPDPTDISTDGAGYPYPPGTQTAVNS